MPEFWIHSIGTSAGSWGSTDYDKYCDSVIQAQLARQQQMWEAEVERRIKEREKAKQLKKDKEKYPLFFLKEGIV